MPNELVKQGTEKAKGLANDGLDKAKDFANGEPNPAEAIQKIGDILTDSDNTEHLVKIGITVPDADGLAPKTIIVTGAELGECLVNGGFLDAETNTADMQTAFSDYLKGKDSGNGATAAYNSLSEGQQDSLTTLLIQADSVNTSSFTFGMTDHPIVNAIETAAGAEQPITKEDVASGIKSLKKIKDDPWGSLFGSGDDKKEEEPEAKSFHCDDVTANVKTVSLNHTFSIELPTLNDDFVNARNNTSQYALDLASVGMENHGTAQETQAYIEQPSTPVDAKVKAFDIA